MNDRELIHAAAKAAGYDKTMQTFAACDSAGSWTQYAKHVYWNAGRERRDYWNPLNDDGDALRLAVKLRIEVEPWIHGDSACSRAACGEVLIDEPHYGDDPERATRRAIVRAAAALAA
jgi:hypothetical protein